MIHSNMKAFKQYLIDSEVAPTKPVPKAPGVITTQQQKDDLVRNLPKKSKSKKEPEYIKVGFNPNSRSNAIRNTLSNAAAYYSSIPYPMLGPLGKALRPFSKLKNTTDNISILQQLRNHKAEAEKQTPKTPKTKTPTNKANKTRPRGKKGVKPVIKSSSKGQSSGGFNPPQP